MGIKRVIGTILNIVDGKPAAEGNYSYITDVLEKGTSQIEGGLVLSNIVAVADQNGNVVSYINGWTGNPTAFAAGVQNFGLSNETKKTALNHNGSGHLASGKINWDEQGNAVIGGFYILSDRLSSSPTGTGKRHDMVSSTTGQAYDEWYNESDVLVAREGFIEGKQQKIWYAEDGTKIASIGENGITSYVVPESFAEVIIALISTLPTTYSPLTNAQKTAVKYDLENTYLEDSYLQNQAYFKATYKLNKYYYNAGTNTTSESNKIYEGYKNTQSKTDNVANGWYVVNGNIVLILKRRTPSSDYWFASLNLVFLNDGKIAAGSSTKIEVEFYKTIN